MKKTDIIINNSNGLTVIEKMDFDGVDAVNDALNFAFHPDGIKENEEIDTRMMSLFSIFLSSVGWTEEEYWDEVHFSHDCPNCNKTNNSDSTVTEIKEEKKPDPKSN